MDDLNWELLPVGDDGQPADGKGWEGRVRVHKLDGKAAVFCMDARLLQFAPTCTIWEGLVFECRLLWQRVWRWCSGNKNEVK